MKLSHRCDGLYAVMFFQNVAHEDIWVLDHWFRLLLMDNFQSVLSMYRVHLAGTYVKYFVKQV